MNTLEIRNLVARSDRMTVDKMRNRLYGAKCKWESTMTLDDSIFDRHYLLISKCEYFADHCNGNQMVSPLQREIGRGLRVRIEHRVHRNLNEAHWIVPLVWPRNLSLFARGIIQRLYRSECWMWWKVTLDDRLFETLTLCGTNGRSSIQSSGGHQNK